MFEQLEKLSQQELLDRKQELETRSDAIEKEIKQLNKKLRRGLIWWIICVPLIGIVIYQFHLGHRINNNHELGGEIGARKFKQANLKMELMKIDTLIIGK